MTTPVCPACGAKFSHSATLAACSKCGLPDEVSSEGPQAIARWKRKPTGVKTVGSVLVPGQRLDNISKKARKRQRTAGRQRRRNAHGRTHA